MSAIHGAMALVATTLACAAAIVDGPRGAAAAGAHTRPRFISAPELAERIIRRDPALRVLDLRPHAEYERLHVPGAAHTTLRRLATEPLPPAAAAVVYANTQMHATRAWALLNARGLREVSILRGGLYEWIVRIQEPRLAVDATAVERAEFEEAVRWSRFFGGRVHENVPRSEVPTGYWSAGTQRREGSLEQTLLAVAAIRRRGC